mmetsp:Transcript_277/g.532  ORF Transcript_277/g.532 Transcript_277/m.532 type:complete len:453 (-) Transcript_277:88-1446(-)
MECAFVQLDAKDVEEWVRNLPGLQDITKKLIIEQEFDGQGLLDTTEKELLGFLKKLGRVKRFSRHLDAVRRDAMVDKLPSCRSSSSSLDSLENLDLDCEESLDNISRKTALVKSANRKKRKGNSVTTPKKDAKDETSSKKHRKTRYAKDKDENGLNCSLQNLDRSSSPPSSTPGSVTSRRKTRTTTFEFRRKENLERAAKSVFKNSNLIEDGMVEDFVRYVGSEDDIREFEKLCKLTDSKRSKLQFLWTHHFSVQLEAEAVHNWYETYDKASKRGGKRKILKNGSNSNVMSEDTDYFRDDDYDDEDESGDSDWDCKTEDELDDFAVGEWVMVYTEIAGFEEQPPLILGQVKQVDERKKKLNVKLWHASDNTYDGTYVEWNPEGGKTSEFIEDFKFSEVAMKNLEVELPTGRLYFKKTKLKPFTLEDIQGNSQACYTLYSTQGIGTSNKELWK